jgi:hypothetical protein
MSPTSYRAAPPRSISILPQREAGQTKRAAREWRDGIQQIGAGSIANSSYINGVQESRERMRIGSTLIHGASVTFFRFLSLQEYRPRAKLPGPAEIWRTAMERRMDLRTDRASSASVEAGRCACMVLAALLGWSAIATGPESGPGASSDKATTHSRARHRPLNQLRRRRRRPSRCRTHRWRRVS